MCYFEGALVSGVLSAVNIIGAKNTSSLIDDTKEAHGNKMYKMKLKHDTVLVLLVCLFALFW